MEIMVPSRIIIATLLMASSFLSAEERTWALRNADVVVVGKLDLSSYFLYFDGVHVNGSIVPTEILYGPAQAGVRLRYSNIIPRSVLDWIRSDRPVKCDYTMVWSQWSFVKSWLTQPGVWLLLHAPEASWTGRGSDPGFRRLDSRDYSVSILSKRKQLEAGP
jgi:hypothetical protein